jgi:photosystem II stability/assembly factor-like uncharacterized protein
MRMIRIHNRTCTRALRATRAGVMAASLMAPRLAAQRGGRGAAPGPPPLTASPSDPLAALRFRSVGPAFTSGRHADMAVDPNNPHVWYVAMAAGGLWKTTNGGLTFTPIFDTYGAYSMCCVLVDPKRSNVVWLATGENTNLRSASAGEGVFKSTDAGATWQRVGLERSEKIGRMAIDPRNSDVVWVAAQGPLWSAGGDRGLYETSDGGATWKAVLQISENTGVTDVVLDPRNPDVVYAAAYQRRRHAGLLIGGGPEAGIYKSTDGGTTFKRLTAGLPTVDLGRIALALSPQRPDVVYASITAQGKESGFFRSSDAGETWTKQNAWNTNDPQYYGELFTDPARFDRVCALAVTNVCTNDGGKTFVPMNWSVHVDNHHIGFDPADSMHLWSGNDGGLYESLDAGVTWRHFQIPATQFYAITLDNALPFYNIYGGTQDNGSIGTPSRSAHPSGIRASEGMTVGGGDGFQARADVVDNNTLYTSSQNGAIRRLDKRTGESKSVAPPRTWGSEKRTRTAFEMPYIISPHNHNRLYVLANVLFRSDNRGDAYTAVSGDLTRALDRDTFTVMGRKWGPDAVNKNLYTNDLSVGTSLDESPLREGLLYVGTDDGLVQVSENAGRTWRSIGLFPGVPDFTFVSKLLASRHDTNVVYAAFNNMLRGDFQPYLLRSTDRGRSWTSIRANLPGRDQIWTLAEDHVNRNILFAGTEHGAYVTLDGGQSWQPLRAGLPSVAVRDIQIQRRENDLVLATFGRGIYVVDDYSPLRALAAHQPISADGFLVPPRPAHVYVEAPFQRAGVGNGLFTGENPPFGALLSYVLRDPTPAGARTVLVIKNASGKTINEVAGPGGAGLNRAVWNLRHAPDTTAVRADSGRGAARGGRGAGAVAPADTTGVEPGAPQRGGGRGGPPPPGPLVTPGTYTVQLARRTGATLTAIGVAQRIQVIPIER